MPDHRLKGRASAERISHNVCLREAEIFQQRRNIIRKGFQAEGTVDVGRMPMSLQLYSDHLPVSRQFLDKRLVHTDHTQATMEQDDRFAAAVDPIIKFEPIDRRLARLGGGKGGRG